MCLSAAVADLSPIGMAFSELVLDCGNVDCAHCTTMREASSKVESGIQKPARLRQSTGESSPLIPRQAAEKTLEELCGLERFEEWESIDEIIWSAADEEQPELTGEINERCDLEEDDDYEMVDLDEARIDLIEIDEARVMQMSKGKGKAVVVRRWFT